jgi:multidrug efflux pump subunit AcrA (membrane-fusion protein)
MSTNTESVDPELVEETKQQIRVLVNEIAQLAASDLPESEFYEGFLNRVVTALAAHGGVIWDVSNGPLQVAHQIALRESGILANEENQMAHGRLLRKLIETGEPMLVAPHSGPGDESEGANPTEHLIVLGVLRADQDVQGILEIFQRVGAPPATQRGYLRFVAQMCDLAGDYLKTRSLRRFGHRQTLWNQIEQFTRAVHRTLDARSTAYALANEGRRLVECDRITVAMMKGSKCKVEAISGQDTFDKRANQVVLLEKLANAVVRQGEPVWYTGSTEDFPPQVEDAVQAYVDESHSKTVAIIPLRREKIVDETKLNEEREPIVGALVVEQIEDTKLKEGMLSRVEVVAQHGANALANSVEHNSVFLMPLWRAIGRSAVVVKARNLPKTVTITLAVAAVIAGLCIVPADYTLEGDGTIQPAQRQDVFASVQGTVREVFKGTGAEVKEGEKLVRLENIQLQVEWQNLQKQRNEALTEISSKQILLGSIRDEVERKRVQSEISLAQTKVSGLEIELDLVDEQRDQLTLTAPTDGVVVTWDVENKLEGRPVAVGQVLMTIARPDGPWELEVEMPEDRMGDIAQARLDVKRANPNDDLMVDYILATEPKTKYTDKLTEVGELAEVVKQEGSTVKLRVAIDEQQNTAMAGKLKEYRRGAETDIRPGATVKARVHCGRAAIGYVWFHDLVNFVYSRVLFRFF